MPPSSRTEAVGPVDSLPEGQLSALATTDEKDDVVGQESGKEGSKCCCVLNNSLGRHLLVRCVARDVLQHTVSARDVETREIGPAPGSVRLYAAYGRIHFRLASAEVGHHYFDALIPVGDAVVSQVRTGEAGRGQKLQLVRRIGVDDLERISALRHNIMVMD